MTTAAAPRLRVDPVKPDALSRAICLGPESELWFALPESEDWRDAKTACIYCPVRQACGQWAVESGQRHGIWAGFDIATERAELRDWLGIPSPAAPKSEKPAAARDCSRCSQPFVPRRFQSAEVCWQCTHGTGDINAARSHVDSLRAANMTLGEIAKAADISHETVRSVAYGDRKTASTRTLDAILSVEVPAQPLPPVTRRPRPPRSAVSACVGCQRPCGSKTAVEAGEVSLLRAAKGKCASCYARARRVCPL